MLNGNIINILKNQGAALSAPFFYAKFKKIIMSDEDQKKPEIPHRMSRIAFPKAKYGVYLAIIIIVVVLLVFYRDSIF